jgi:TolB protein
MIRLLCILLTVISFAQMGHAQENGLYIKLGEARTKKSMMAFPALQYFGSPTTASRYQSVGSEMFNTITNERCGFP